MNVKRYIAEDVTKAMDKIRSELGRDAFILNTRKIRRRGVLGVFQKPLVEVVAAYETDAAPARAVGSDINPEAEAVYLPLSKTTAAGAAPASAVKSLLGAPAAAPGNGTAPLNTFAATAYGQRRPVRDGVQSAGSDGNGGSLLPQEGAVGARPNGDTTRHSLLAAIDAALPERESVGPIVAEPLSRGKIEVIESKLDSLSTAVGLLVGKMNLKTAGVPNGYTPDVEALVLSLLENEVHEEFAHKIGKEVMDIVLRQNEDPNDVMEQILKQYFGEIAPIKLKRFKRTVVIFLGPTGVGKTTTLAKLAAIFSLNHHARVGVITTDTYRIAAVEQLKTYAEILEVPLTVVYSVEDVSEALKDHTERDIVFIDTAGKSPQDPSLESEIIKLLKQSEADEVHLVLSSTTSFAGCLNIIETYSFLKDYKLLFTKMDESPTYGMLLNLKFLTDRNISYMAFGQNVPDDIEVFNAQKVIDRLMGRERK